MKYFVLFLLLPFTILANQNVVNFYNWAGYVPESIITEFTKETGIKVNFSTFSSNSELYAKIASANNHSGYDVIVPSANFVSRMRKQNMLEKINKKYLPNFKNLDPHFLNKAYDPGNHYSIPYFWGSTGIIINKHFYPKLTINKWSDLWDPKLKNQLLLLNEIKSTFEIALRVLHYPTNSRNPKQIKAAYQKLLSLLPNIKLFNIISPQAIFINGDVGLGVIYNGDAYLAMQQNKNLYYIYPKDGIFVWTDCMVIPKNAPHLANAYKLINFILRPDIAAKIAKNAGYSSPNKAAKKLLPKSMRDSKVLYPNKNILQKATFESDLGSANAIYQHYWQLLKLNA